MKLTKITSMTALILGLVVSTIAASLLPAQQSSAASCTSSMFRQGSRGTCVRYIQTLNNYHASMSGYANFISSDGIFGARTDSSIRKFQGNGYIRADGIVGSQTWAKLCSKGNFGDLSNPYQVPGSYPINTARAAGCPNAWAYHY